MISGQMYFHKEHKKSLSDIIRMLIDVYKIKNIKYVLVHPDQLSEIQMVDELEIRPKTGILPNHYWFIDENNIENRPKYANFEK